LSDAGRAVAERPELSLNEIEKISSSMGPLLWLAFSGGEIFLRDDIDQIAQLFYEKNTPSIMLFPTNGLLSRVIAEKVESILKTCTKSTVVVKLSLEGPETVHDSIRGEGSFNKTMKTYEKLGVLLDRYDNFELGINTLFCSQTQDTMDELIEFVTGLDKIKTHTVSLIRGSVGDEQLKEVDMGKYHETITKLASNLHNRISATYRFKGAKLKAAQDIVQRSIIHRTMVDSRQIIPCYAGKLNLVLTESGDVYPCESFTMKLGNVREHGYSMKHIADTPQAKKIINSIHDRKCYPQLAKEYVRL
jgi:MoaA/NifB/PqqE/SkfB family radical SAM enzyme